MSKLTGVLVDPKNNITKIVTIEDTLQNLYSLLGCQIIEVASRRIGYPDRRNTKYFDIICDEEGLYVEDPYISAIDNLGRAMLVGSLFIVSNDGEGNFKSLTPAECKRVQERVLQMSTHKHPKPYCMLTQCEY